MRTSLIKISAVLLFMLSLAGCQKEEVKVFEVEQITLYNSASEKKNLKSDAQFLSILYTDLFGISITAQEMSILARSYNSFGDKSLVIDMLIRTMLVSGTAEVPSNTAMRADIEGFVAQAFKRFYVRNATAQEVWFFNNLIKNEPDLLPTDVYYALLTANEYRYY